MAVLTLSIAATGLRDESLPLVCSDGVVDVCKVAQVVGRALWVLAGPVAIEVLMQIEDELVGPALRVRDGLEERVRLLREGAAGAVHSARDEERLRRRTGCSDAVDRLLQRGSPQRHVERVRLIHDAKHDLLHPSVLCRELCPEVDELLVGRTARRLTDDGSVPACVLHKNTRISIGRDRYGRRKGDARCDSRG